VRVLPYGIPDPATKVQPTPRDPSQPLKFLMLGTVEHRKGQQVLLAALQKLSPDVLRNARFDIVGRPHDPAVTAEVRAAAEGASYLNFVSGVSPEEALALVAQTDVMISASWDETGPFVLMEAAALGKALISTDVGAVAELLRPGEEALFFKRGDADALAAAIERLVREPNLVQQLGLAARNAYEQHFTFERFGAEFGELVRETVRGGRTRTGAAAGVAVPSV
jgi:glycosyltransferase involved in cell wall biosynthesis